MMEIASDIPLWAALMMTVLGGGFTVLGYWMKSRGQQEEGDAAIIAATDGRMALIYSRLEAELERLDRTLQTERDECDRRISALEIALQQETGHRQELEETVRILVAHFDEISEPLPMEIA